jgi:hypothetical protein
MAPGSIAPARAAAGIARMRVDFERQVRNHLLMTSMLNGHLRREGSVEIERLDTPAQKASTLSCRFIFIKHAILNFSNECGLEQSERLARHGTIFVVYASVGDLGDNYIFLRSTDNRYVASKFVMIAQKIRVYANVRNGSNSM